MLPPKEAASVLPQRQIASQCPASRGEEQPVPCAGWHHSSAISEGGLPGELGSKKPLFSRALNTTE